MTFKTVAVTVLYRANAVFRVLFEKPVTFTSNAER